MKFLTAADIGTITPPQGVVPDIAGDPTSFVAGLVRAGIQMLLLGSFLIALIWTIIAGLKFIFSGSDEKAVGQAWAQIYWGLTGMAIVLGSFAIIKLVETFFGVDIISGGLRLPQR